MDPLTRLVRAVLDELAEWRAITSSLPRPHWVLTLVLIGSVARTGLALPLPLLARKIVDEALPKEDMTQLALLCGLMLVAFCGSTVIGVWVRRIALTFTTQGIVGLRQRLRDLVATASLDDLRLRGHVGLHDTLVTNVTRVDNLTIAIVAMVFPSAILAAGLAVMLFAIDWRLALVSLAILPTAIPLGRWLGGRAREAWRRHHEIYRNYSDLVLRAGRLAPLIRASGADGIERLRHDDMARAVGAWSRRARVIAQANSAALRMLVILASTVMLVVGAMLVTHDQMTSGRLVAFLAGFALLRDPLQQMITTMPVIAEGRPALAIVNDLLRLETSRPPPDRDRRAIRLEGRIQLERVGFAYPAGPPLFTDVDLELVPGKVTALIGANGIGKSTLVSLVLGLRQPTTGRILADGVPYEVLDLEHLRQQMAVVFQELMLDEGSVAEVIGYGLDDPGGDRIERAARLAGADTVIEALRDGYDTVIGRKGVELSLGQHQRLAIARALAREPAVLILDEPTNHLDPAAVQHVLTQLRRLDRLPATLVVSHHHEVVEWADDVVQMETWATPPAISRQGVAR